MSAGCCTTSKNSMLPFRGILLLLLFCITSTSYVEHTLASHGATVPAPATPPPSTGASPAAPAGGGGVGGASMGGSSSPTTSNAQPPQQPGDATATGPQQQSPGGATTAQGAVGSNGPTPTPARSWTSLFGFLRRVGLPRLRAGAMGAATGQAGRGVAQAARNVAGSTSGVWQSTFARCMRRDSGNAMRELLQGFARVFGGNHRDGGSNGSGENPPAASTPGATSTSTSGTSRAGFSLPDRMGFGSLWLLSRMVLKVAKCVMEAIPPLLPLCYWGSRKALAANDNVWVRDPLAHDNWVTGFTVENVFRDPVTNERKVKLKNRPVPVEYSRVLQGYEEPKVICDETLQADSPMLAPHDSDSLRELRRRATGEARQDPQFGLLSQVLLAGGHFLSSYRDPVNSIVTQLLRGQNPWANGNDPFQQQQQGGTSATSATGARSSISSTSSSTRTTTPTPAGGGAPSTSSASPAQTPQNTDPAFLRGDRDFCVTVFGDQSICGRRNRFIEFARTDEEGFDSEGAMKLLGVNYDLSYEHYLWQSEQQTCDKARTADRVFPIVGEHRGKRPGLFGNFDHASQQVTVQNAPGWIISELSTLLAGTANAAGNSMLQRIRPFLEAVRTAAQWLQTRVLNRSSSNGGGAASGGAAGSVAGVAAPAGASSAGTGRTTPASSAAEGTTGAAAGASGGANAAGSGTNSAATSGAPPAQSAQPGSSVPPSIAPTNTPLATSTTHQQPQPQAPSSQPPPAEGGTSTSSQLQPATPPSQSPAPASDPPEDDFSDYDLVLDVVALQRLYLTKGKFEFGLSQTDLGDLVVEGDLKEAGVGIKNLVLSDVWTKVPGFLCVRSGLVEKIQLPHFHFALGFRASRTLVEEEFHRKLVAKRLMSSTTRTSGNRNSAFGGEQSSATPTTRTPTTRPLRDRHLVFPSRHPKAGSNAVAHRFLYKLQGNSSGSATQMNISGINANNNLNQQNPFLSAEDRPPYKFNPNVLIEPNWQWTMIGKPLFTKSTTASAEIAQGGQAVDIQNIRCEHLKINPSHTMIGGLTRLAQTLSGTSSPEMEQLVKPHVALFVREMLLDGNAASSIIPTLDLLLQPLMVRFGTILAYTLSERFKISPGFKQVRAIANLKQCESVDPVTGAVVLLERDACGTVEVKQPYYALLNIPRPTAMLAGSLDMALLDHEQATVVPAVDDGRGNQQGGTSPPPSGSLSSSPARTGKVLRVWHANKRQRHNVLNNSHQQNFNDFNTFDGVGSFQQHHQQIHNANRAAGGGQGHHHQNANANLNNQFVVEPFRLLTGLLKPLTDRVRLTKSSFGAGNSDFSNSSMNNSEDDDSDNEQFLSAEDQEVEVLRVKDVQLTPSFGYVELETKLQDAALEFVEDGNSAQMLNGNGVVGGAGAAGNPGGQQQTLNPGAAGGGPGHQHAAGNYPNSGGGYVAPATNSVFPWLKRVSGIFVHLKSKVKVRHLTDRYYPFDVSQNARLRQDLEQNEFRGGVEEEVVDSADQHHFGSGFDGVAVNRRNNGQQEQDNFRLLASDSEVENDETDMNVNSDHEDENEDSAPGDESDMESARSRAENDDSNLRNSMFFSDASEVEEDQEEAEFAALQQSDGVLPRNHPPHRRAGGGGDGNLNQNRHQHRRRGGNNARNRGSNRNPNRQSYPATEKFVDFEQKLEEAEAVLEVSENAWNIENIFVRLAGDREDHLRSTVAPASNDGNAAVQRNQQSQNRNTQNQKRSVSSTVFQFEKRTGYYEGWNFAQLSSFEFIAFLYLHVMLFSFVFYLLFKVIGEHCNRTGLTCRARLRRTCCGRSRRDGRLVCAKYFLPACCVEKFCPRTRSGRLRSKSSARRGSKSGGRGLKLRTRSRSNYGNSYGKRGGHSSSCSSSRNRMMNDRMRKNNETIVPRLSRISWSSLMSRSSNTPESGDAHCRQGPPRQRRSRSRHPFHQQSFEAEQELFTTSTSFYDESSILTSCSSDDDWSDEYSDVATDDEEVASSDHDEYVLVSEEDVETTPDHVDARRGLGGRSGGGRLLAANVRRRRCATRRHSWSISGSKKQKASPQAFPHHGSRGGGLEDCSPDDPHRRAENDAARNLQQAEHVQKSAGIMSPAVEDVGATATGSTASASVLTNRHSRQLHPDNVNTVLSSSRKASPEVTADAMRQSFHKRRSHSDSSVWAPGAGSNPGNPHETHPPHTSSRRRRVSETSLAKERQIQKEIKRQRRYTQFRKLTWFFLFPVFLSTLPLFLLSRKMNQPYLMRTVTRQVGSSGSSNQQEQDPDDKNLAHECDNFLRRVKKTVSLRYAPNGSKQLSQLTPEDLFPDNEKERELFHYCLSSRVTLTKLSVNVNGLRIPMDGFHWVFASLMPTYVWMEGQISLLIIEYAAFEEVIESSDGDHHAGADYNTDSEDVDSDENEDGTGSGGSSGYNLAQNRRNHGNGQVDERDVDADFFTLSSDVLNNADLMDEEDNFAESNAENDRQDRILDTLIPPHASRSFQAAQQQQRSNSPGAPNMAGSSLASGSSPGGTNSAGATAGGNTSGTTAADQQSNPAASTRRPKQMGRKPRRLLSVLLCSGGGSLYAKIFGSLWPSHACNYPNANDGPGFGMGGNLFVRFMSSVLIATDGINAIINRSISYSQQRFIREWLSKIRILYSRKRKATVVSMRMDVRVHDRPNPNEVEEELANNRLSASSSGDCEEIAAQGAVGLAQEGADAGGQHQHQNVNHTNRGRTGADAGALATRKFKNRPYCRFRQKLLQKMRRDQSANPLNNRRRRRNPNFHYRGHNFRNEQQQQQQSAAYEEKPKRDIEVHIGFPNVADHGHHNDRSAPNRRSDPARPSGQSATAGRAAANEDDAQSEDSANNNTPGDHPQYPIDLVGSINRYMERAIVKMGYIPYFINFYYSNFCQMRVLDYYGASERSRTGDDHHQHPQSNTIYPLRKVLGQQNQNGQEQQQNNEIRVHMAQDFTSVGVTWDDYLEVPINFPNFFNPTMTPSCSIEDDQNSMNFGWSDVEDEGLNYRGTGDGDTSSATPAGNNANGRNHQPPQPAASPSTENGAQGAAGGAQQQGGADSAAAPNGAGGATAPPPASPNNPAQQPTSATPAEGEAANLSRTQVASQMHQDSQSQLFWNQRLRTPETDILFSKQENPHSRFYKRIPEFYGVRLNFLEKLQLNQSVRVNFDVLPPPVLVSQNNMNQQGSAAAFASPSVNPGPAVPLNAKFTSVRRPRNFYDYDIWRAQISTFYYPGFRTSRMTSFDGVATPFSGAAGLGGATNPNNARSPQDHQLYLTATSIAEQINRGGAASTAFAAPYTNLFGGSPNGGPMRWYVGQRVIARTDILATGLEQTCCGASEVKKRTKGVITRLEYVQVDKVPASFAQTLASRAGFAAARSGSGSVSPSPPGTPHPDGSGGHQSFGGNNGSGMNNNSSSRNNQSVIILEVLFNTGVIRELRTRTKYGERILLENYLKHDVEFDDCVSRWLYKDRKLRNKMLTILNKIFKPDRLRSQHSQVAFSQSGDKIDINFLVKKTSLKSTTRGNNKPGAAGAGFFARNHGGNVVGNNKPPAMNRPLGAAGGNNNGNNNKKRRLIDPLIPKPQNFANQQQHVVSDPSYPFLLPLAEVQETLHSDFSKHVFTLEKMGQVHSRCVEMQTSPIPLSVTMKVLEHLRQSNMPVFNSLQELAIADDAETWQGSKPVVVSLHAEFPHGAGTTLGAAAGGSSGPSTNGSSPDGILSASLQSLNRAKTNSKLPLILPAFGRVEDPHYVGETETELSALERGRPFQLEVHALHPEESDAAFVSSAVDDEDPQQTPQFHSPAASPVGGVNAVPGGRSPAGSSSSSSAALVPRDDLFPPPLSLDLHVNIRSLLKAFVNENEQNEAGAYAYHEKVPCTLLKLGQDKNLRARIERDLKVEGHTSIRQVYQFLLRETNVHNILNRQNEETMTNMKLDCTLDCGQLLLTKNDVPNGGEKYVGTNLRFTRYKVRVLPPVSPGSVQPGENPDDFVDLRFQVRDYSQLADTANQAYSNSICNASQELCRRQRQQNRAGRNAEEYADIRIPKSAKKFLLRLLDETAKEHERADAVLRRAVAFSPDGGLWESEQRSGGGATATVPPAGKAAAGLAAAQQGTGQNPAPASGAGAGQQIDGTTNAAVHNPANNDSATSSAPPKAAAPAGAGATPAAAEPKPAAKQVTGTRTFEETLPLVSLFQNASVTRKVSTQWIYLQPAFEFSEQVVKRDPDTWKNSKNFFPWQTYQVTGDVIYDQQPSSASSSYSSPHLGRECETKFRQCEAHPNCFAVSYFPKNQNRNNGLASSFGADGVIAPAAFDAGSHGGAQHHHHLQHQSRCFLTYLPTIFGTEKYYKTVMNLSYAELYKELERTIEKNWQAWLYHHNPASVQAHRQSPQGQQVAGAAASPSPGGSSLSPASVAAFETAKKLICENLQKLYASSKFNSGGAARRRLRRGRHARQGRAESGSNGGLCDVEPVIFLMRPRVRHLPDYRPIVEEEAVVLPPPGSPSAASVPPSSGA
ncbi:unnamed protein product [Amoebophrya sp. A120]|nr:unnamed protein product [Amoebophrya sp. A120]|eukprot:GSA120T00007580001.1